MTAADRLRPAAAAVPGRRHLPESSSFSTTFSQISRFSSNVLAVWRAAKSTSPDLTLALWQATQLFCTNANTSGDSAPGDNEEATRAVASMGRIRAIDSLHLRLPAKPEGNTYTMLSLDRNPALLED